LCSGANYFADVAAEVRRGYCRLIEEQERGCIWGDIDNVVVIHE
jgi:hypothetical protein